MNIINPTNKFEIESFLQRKNIQNEILDLKEEESTDFFIASFSNTLLHDIIIEVSNIRKGSEQSKFIVKVFSLDDDKNKKKNPFLHFSYFIHIVIEFNSSSAISDISYLPEIKKTKLILAVNTKTDQFLYKDLTTNTLAFDWEKTDFELIIEGFYRDENTLYFDTEEEFSSYLRNLNYDVSFLVPSVICILNDYLDLEISEEEVLKVLSSNIVELSLIGETASSITDTLPRENIISLFQKLY